MTTVQVTFSTSSKLYSYSTGEKDIKAGDLAVVDTPSAGFSLVTVQSVLDEDFLGNKPVVGIIRLDAYKAHLAKLARKAEILAQLQRANAAKAEVERFAHLKTDPALAKLVEELEGLA